MLFITYYSKNHASIIHQGLVATSHRLAICVIVSGFRAALDLNTYPLRNLIRPRCAERAKPGRGKPVLIMHIGFFTCFHAISLKSSRFSKIGTLFFLSLVALKLLVSLISRLVDCSARIVVERQTDTQTDTQNDYCNPRCTCAPRVNKYQMLLPARVGGAAGGTNSQALPVTCTQIMGRKQITSVF